MQDGELSARMGKAMDDRSGVMALDLVRSADVGAAFGVTANRAAMILKRLGAVQLPRCTRGGGIPAFRLFCLRDAEHYGAMTLRQRTEHYMKSRERLA